MVLQVQAHSQLRRSVEEDVKLAVSLILVALVQGRLARFRQRLFLGTILVGVRDPIAIITFLEAVAVLGLRLSTR